MGARQLTLESLEAHRHVAKTADATREAVFAWVRARGDHGATADEVAAAFRCSPNHTAPRVCELRKAGRLVKAGRRVTRAGCMAAVLVAVGL